MDQLWLIRSSGSRTPTGDKWGDSFFADALRRSLLAQGSYALEIRCDESPPPITPGKDLQLINLALLGLKQPPTIPNALNIAWIISHPELITREILDSYDLILTSSFTYAAELSRQTGRRVIPLLQAADTRFFNTDQGLPETKLYDAVFVGQSNNGRQRPLIEMAVSTDHKILVFGPGWEGRIPPESYGGPFLDYAALPSLYSKSRYVLADHWPEMTRLGFTQNRVFDAVAHGSRVITDYFDENIAFPTGYVTKVETRTELDAILRQNETLSVKERREQTSGFARRHSFHARAETLKELVASHFNSHDAVAE